MPPVVQQPLGHVLWSHAGGASGPTSVGASCPCVPSGLSASLPTLPSPASSPGVTPLLLPLPLEEPPCPSCPASAPGAGP